MRSQNSSKNGNRFANIKFTEKHEDVVVPLRASKRGAFKNVGKPKIGLAFERKRKKRE